MDFILDDTIDNYIQDAEAFDRKVAQHLKEIIPNTTHINKILSFSYEELSNWIPSRLCTEMMGISLSMKGTKQISVIF